jgi:hypothetical protein
LNAFRLASSAATTEEEELELSIKVAIVEQGVLMAKQRKRNGTGRSLAFCVL